MAATSSSIAIQNRECRRVTMPRVWFDETLEDQLLREGSRARSSRALVGARLFQSGGVLREEIVSDGEDGANPSRCRHCKRGVTLHNATVRFGTWEGAGKRRAASQETQLTDVSTQPFESKGGSIWRGLFVRCRCRSCLRVPVFALSYPVHAASDIAVADEPDQTGPVIETREEVVMLQRRRRSRSTKSQAQWKSLREKICSSGR